MQKCKVVSYNEHRNVLVFDYMGNKIQTHYHFDSVPDFVYVDKNGDTYNIELKNKVKPKKKPKNVEAGLVVDTFESGENIVVD